MGIVKLFNRFARGLKAEKPVLEEKWAQVRTEVEGDAPPTFSATLAERAVAAAEPGSGKLLRVPAQTNLRVAATRTAALHTAASLAPASPTTTPVDGGVGEAGAVEVLSPRPTGRMFRRRNGFTVPQVPLVYSPVVSLTPPLADGPVHLCPEFFDAEDLEADQGEGHLSDAMLRRLHNRRNALPGTTDVSF